MNKNTTLVIVAIIIIVAIGGFLMMRNKSNSNQTMNNSDTQTEAQTTTQTEESTTAPVTGEMVIMDVKDFGQIKIALNSEAAPKTVENFLKLVNDKFYDGLTFHRIAAGFVIQGGDPKGDGTGGPGYTIPAEIKLPHTKGSIAMARLGDQVNPGKESSGSQFYIALEALPMLDNQYTVFGEVVEGMDVVAKIGAVPINAGPFGGSDGPPQTPVVISSITIVK